MISPLIPQRGSSNSTGIRTIRSISMKKNATSPAPEGLYPKLSGRERAGDNTAARKTGIQPSNEFPPGENAHLAAMEAFMGPGINYTTIMP
jgi:hypothetical protein